jgi:hypothetical protein
MKFFELCKGTLINLDEAVEISIWESPPTTDDSIDDYFKCSILFRFKKDPSKELEYEFKDSEEAYKTFNEIQKILM